MIIRQKDIDALRDKLKIGDHVTYRTEAIDIKLGYVQKEDNGYSGIHGEERKGPGSGAEYHYIPGDILPAQGIDLLSHLDSF